MNFIPNAYSIELAPRGSIILALIAFAIALLLACVSDSNALPSLEDLLKSAPGAHDVQMRELKLVDAHRFIEAI